MDLLVDAPLSFSIKLSKYSERLDLIARYVRKGASQLKIFAVRLLCLRNNFGQIKPLPRCSMYDIAVRRWSIDVIMAIDCLA